MFEPDKIYKNGNPALLALAAQSTWDHWRADGTGPRFVKLAQGKGGRVVYRGSDLNTWLESRTVEPTGAAGDAA